MLGMSFLLIAQQNMAGMHTMGKHCHFSTCDQKHVNHAKRRAQHRPLKQENVLVWKQHSFLSTFLGALHTHAYHPVLWMSVSPGFIPPEYNSFFFPITTISGVWLVTPYLKPNKRRKAISLLPSEDHQDCHILSVMLRALAAGSSIKVATSYTLLDFLINNQ